MCKSASDGCIQIHSRVTDLKRLFVTGSHAVLSASSSTTIMAPRVRFQDIAEEDGEP